MAGPKEIKVKVTTDYDDRAANEALADVEKLDAADPTISVDVANVLTAMDQVAAATKETAAAADALGRALGPELAAKADTTAMVQDLQKAGLTIEDITVNADRLGNKLRELSDIDVGGKLGRNLGTARGRLDELGASAGSSRSVLANMVGNSTQDLASLGGFAGSAGVAIGQMGEYMADARLSGEAFGSVLGNFAKVAGPIAAVSLALAGINNIMGEMRKGQAATKAFDVDQVTQFNEALKDTGDLVDNYSNQLEDTGQVLVDTGRKAGPAWTQILPGVNELVDNIGLLGKFGEELEDILPTLNQAGIDSKRWSEITTAGIADQAAQLQGLRDDLIAANIAEEDRRDIMQGARAAQDNYTEALKKRREQEQFFGVTGTNPFTAANQLMTGASNAARIASVVNNVYNPPGTPPATVNLSDQFYTHNSMRTGG